MKTVKKLLINILLLAVALFQIYPFVLMLFGSLKTPQEFSANPGGLPIFPTFNNYQDLFLNNGGSIARSYFNSILVTAASMAFSLPICALAAFAFAKYEFRGKKLLFLMLVATIMLPGELLIPPLYLMLGKVKLLNSYWVQIFPGLANVFGMYLLRQNMLGISSSVLESARLDGAGEMRIFLNIAMPMTAPAVGAFLILLGLVKWNDFIWPAMMVNNIKYAPIMVILPMLSTESQSIFSTPWELIMSGCVVATMPILILFLMFQDKVMSSVSIGAIKG